MKPKSSWDIYYMAFRPCEKVGSRMGMIDEIDFEIRRNTALAKLYRQVDREKDPFLFELIHSACNINLEKHVCGQCHPSTFRFKPS